MLYIGLDLAYHGFEAAAVSGGFTCLDNRKSFSPQRMESLISWISSLLLSDNEEVAWFFCEKNYLSSRYASSFFLDSGRHFIYLVKDRVVSDFLHSVNVVNEVHDSRVFLDTPLILALSMRIFDRQYIRLKTSDQLTLWPDNYM